MNSAAKFKLTKTQGYVLAVFLISVLMTAVMSLGMILVQTREYTNLGSIWWRQFVIGCYIAVPAGFILVPLIQKAVGMITKE